MNEEEIKDYFWNIVQENSDVSTAISAIRTLMKVLEMEKAETLQGLLENLKNATAVMKKTDTSVTAISSGCALFLCFITLSSDILERKSLSECKGVLLDRGQLFLKQLHLARDKIAHLGAPYIEDGCRVLTHSRSRVVRQTLIEAARANKRFEVYITQSSPDGSGALMKKELEAVSIPCTLILDAAVGYVMEQVDLVMVGAEGVVESGGIINKIGSYTMAVCAKEMKKPFYVLAESFKFVRLYPLNQKDLPDQYKYTSSKLQSNLSQEHPLVDYTPPSYITQLFTDLGILTPSAVSDELIKLYL